ncbi:MAG: hypothetical protein CR982_03035 [Candidatus Cloacimonadota bacterium]|nr:MAG: hypothetical protein CR982_03035 [Candidatus Cloacimonadota bacterium]PIE82039.1 MAG: hypothetical protein CSA15_00225 [Candidatus Delongbacteria bacterium]
MNFLKKNSSKKVILVFYLALIFAASSLSIKTPNLGVSYSDKIFHFFEYFLLGALMFRYLSDVKNCSIAKSLILTIVIGALYAATDEIHQGFVDYFDTGHYG